MTVRCQEWLSDLKFCIELLTKVVDTIECPVFDKGMNIHSTRFPNRITMYPPS